MSRFTLFALLVLVAPFTSFAAVDVDVVKKDFRSASGYLVMEMDDQYLVDLDASSGVRPGDLLSVVETGRKILHPVTGEVIGSLDKVKSVLKVTQVKTGYSYAKLLGEAQTLKAGEVVRRFEQVPALFWDYSGDGESLYQDLAAGLPHFDWQDYQQAQAKRPEVPKALEGLNPTILFILDADGLSIKSSDLSPLRSYSAHAEAQNVAPQALGYQPQVNSGLGRVPQANSGLGNLPLIGGLFKPEHEKMTAGIIRAQSYDQEGVWHSPSVSADIVGLEVAEIDGDGNLEISMLLEDHILISRNLSGELTQVARVDLPRGLKALHIDGADLNNDGRLELFVTAVRGSKIASLVVEYIDGNYQTPITNSSWYFSIKDMPGEGRVLVAQESDYLEQLDFVGEPFRVAREGDELIKSQTLPLPGSLTLFDYHQFVGQDNVRRVAGFTEGGGLVISMPEGVQVWKSAETMGGSLSRIERYINVNAKSVEGMRTQYLRARISAGPNGEILVPVNEGSRMLTRQRSFGSSQLRAYLWNGNILQESWRTVAQSGYLADYRVADVDNDGADELVLAVGYSRKGLVSASLSGLVAYDLQ